MTEQNEETIECLAGGRFPGSDEMPHSGAEHDLMQLESHRVDKATEEEQKAEQHKRFSIKQLAKGFSMAEKALASFDSRTQAVTGCPVLAAVHVIACCKMIYGEKKTPTLQTAVANF